MQLLDIGNRKKIPKELTAKILNEKKVIGLADWDEGRDVIEKFNDEMKIGDIVAVKDGRSPVALVKVIGDAYTEGAPNSNLDWFPIRRNVQLLDFYKDTYGFSMPDPRATLKICSDKDSETYKTIIKWYNNYMENQNNSVVEKLLQLKKQVILQGPPGTGKTRLAEIIARQLTEPKNLGSPLEKIHNFFKNFDASKPEVIERRKAIDELLKTFNNKFPKENLKKMNLAEYAIGTGSNESFCWWIENGLGLISSYFPGSAKTYKIYWDKDNEDYVIIGKLFKDTGNAEEAMKKVASIISDFVINKNFDEASKFFGDSFLLKILQSYYPDEYMPINSAKCLNNSLRLFAVDPSPMNTLQKNLSLQEIFSENKKLFDSDAKNFEFSNFLFDNYDLKGDISVQSSEVITKGVFKFIQFHPAYSYEDFVRGISAKVNNGQIEYIVVNRTLAEFAKMAEENSTANYVLVIDEINRANLPAVLGELIYALEYRGEKVESIYEIHGDKTLVIPTNLYIIGTMNTADRSVGHIDYAIRRRFEFVNILPQSIPELTEKGKQLFSEVALLFCKVFKENEIELENSEDLAPDFNATDVMLGHSYFLIKDEERKSMNMNDDDILKLKLEYEIKPILYEYVKDGILLETAKVKIQKLKIDD